MKITSLIVEDEPIARDIISSYVNKLPEIEILGEFNNTREALMFLKNESVDVIFLDINISPISGIDLIKSLPDPPFIVFITAYPQYAAEGFDLSAVDYLIKPVSFERFLKAIQKLKEKLNHSAFPETLSLKSNGRTYLIPLTDILYFQSLGDYIKAICKDQNLIITDTMKQMEKKLNSNFIRVHKSYIINKSYVKYIEGNQLKIQDELIPIGATYRNLFKNFK